MLQPQLKLDFAVNGGKYSGNNQIDAEILTYDEVLLVASPDSPLVNSEYIGLDELAGAKYITHIKDSYLYKLVGDIVNELNLQFNVIMTLGSIDDVKQAVEANLGISAIPRSAINMELRIAPENSG
ncbi:MAG: LysR substrate-binding domain-containing protein [Clostridia bacterium]|nr:LysR substrate-binding domain-containing protein [Clostridia bacterium]